MYVSEIEQDLIPLDIALALVKEHYEIRDPHQIQLSRYSPGLSVKETQWFSFGDCIIICDSHQITSRNGAPLPEAERYEQVTFRIVRKGPPAGGVVWPDDRWQTAGLPVYKGTPAEEYPAFIKKMHDKLVYPGLRSLPKGLSKGEISQLNKRLAAAFVVLGMQPAPGGTYDLNAYINSAR